MRLAHEVRGPVSAMLMWVRLVRAGEVPDRETALAAIEESARTLSRVVDELMETAQYMSGELTIDRVTVELGPVISRAVAMHLAEADSRSIEIELDLAREPLRVLGDAALLEKVVRNLVSNAVHATPDRGRVAVRLTRRRRQAQIDVVDWGPGIPAELLGPLSLPARRLVSKRAAPRGKLGLGLILARQIVALHGGSMRSAGRDAAGAVLRVTLPLSKSKESSDGGRGGRDNG